MKRTNVCAKLLLLVLCFACVLSSLFGCGELQEQVDNLETEVGTKADEAALAELKSLVDQVKATADSAATLAKLEEVAATLDSVKTTADASASLTKLTEVKAELEALVTANGEADAATKATLETAIAKVTELANAAATKVELEAAVKELEDLAATKANAEDVNAQIKNITDTLETLATSTAVAEAVKALNKAIEDGDADLDAQIADLTAAIAANAKADGNLSDMVDELAELVDTKADAEEIAAEFAAMAETIATLATSADVTKAVEALNEAIATKADAATLEAKIAEVNAAIAANAEADGELADMVADLEALAATKADAEEVAAKFDAMAEEIAKLATSDTVTEAVEALNAAIATKADAATLETKIAEVNAAIAANATADKALADKVATLEELAATKADVEAIEAEIADIAETIATLATSADVTAKVEALNTAIATKADKAILDAALADVTDAISTLATKNELANAIAEAVNGMKAEFNAAKVALDNEINALKASVATFTATTEGTLEEHSTAIAALQVAVSTLQASDFAEQYAAATAELYNGTYSKAAFDALIATVKKTDYADDDYARFEAMADRLKFFLTRAISVEEIVKYFAELQMQIDDMPTLTMSLEKLINETPVLLPEAKYLEKIKAIYEKIQNNGVEVPVELQAAYDLIVAAHDNLLAAVAAAPAVEAVISGIATPIVYVDSLAAIVDAEEAYDTYVETYFANEDYTAYYELTPDVAIENYETLTGYRARYNQLVDAAEAKVAVIDIALNYETVRPLFTDYEALAANVEAVEAWIAENEIDDANYAKIYAGEEILLAKATAYALAMKTIYEEHKVAELCANIDALVAKELVLYTDTDLANGYMDAVTAVAKDVFDLVKLSLVAEDNNLEAMLTMVRVKALQEVMARQTELAAAKADIDAVNEQMVALFGNVVITSYETIKSYRAELDAIYTEYVLNEGDANYVELATVAEASYAQLINEYNNATAAVAEAYKKVRDRLDQVAWLVKDGKEIQGIVDELGALIEEHDLINVTLIFESGDIEVDIEKLFVDYITAAAEYKKQATLAANAAVAVNADIAALASKSFTDIKNNALILEVYETFTLWIEEYLAADIDAANGDIRAAIEAIQGIVIYGSTGTYEFVTTANYDLLMQAYNTSVESYAAAEEAWAAIKADMLALNAGYDIHSYNESELNFVAVKAAYDAFVDTYYAGTTDGTIDAEELATVATFEQDMANCLTAKNNAQAAADIINGRIDAIVLADITMGNAANVLAEIEAIRGLIATYTATYCDGMCIIGADRFFHLDKAEKMAEVAAEYNTVYGNATAEQQAEIMEAYLMYVQDYMAGSMTLSGVERFAKAALSQLDVFR